VLAGIAFLPTVSFSGIKSGAAIRRFLDDSPYAPSITGKVSAEGCSAE
jgi:hypothetical protein